MKRGHTSTNMTREEQGRNMTREEELGINLLPQSSSGGVVGGSPESAKRELQSEVVDAAIFVGGSGYGV